MHRYRTLALLLAVCAAASRAASVRASFYNAPSRASFASRHRDWRGRAFSLSYHGRTVRAVCRDFGPFVRGRDIDVSRDVARRLGFTRSGTARLHIAPAR